MINLDDLSQIRSIDKSDFAGLVSNFPRHLEEGAKIAKESPFPKWSLRNFTNIAVCGMGGSAIAADILKSYLSDRIQIPFSVVRHYSLPDFVGPKTLAICSSYSGNTEETLSAFREARKRKAMIISLTTGGRLLKLSKQAKIPAIQIPAGLPPRAALGYSLSALLVFLERLGLVKGSSFQLAKSAGSMESFGRSCKPQTETKNNSAKSLALQFFPKLPVIYAGEDFYPVALRWKQQFCENAKLLAFSSSVPESNHNELVGWEKALVPAKDMAAVFLFDKGYQKQITLRMKIVSEILQEKGVEVVRIESQGKSQLERILHLICLGDWTSYYLAILNQVDPTPIKVIDYLKDRLA